MSTVEQDQMAEREGFTALPGVTAFEHYCYVIYGGRVLCACEQAFTDEKDGHLEDCFG